MDAIKIRFYALVGLRKAHYPEEEDFERVVAWFTSEEKAVQYEKKSRLKSYTPCCTRGIHRQYRRKSLLRAFCRAEVREVENIEKVIDPEI